MRMPPLVLACTDSQQQGSAEYGEKFLNHDRLFNPFNVFFLKNRWQTEVQDTVDVIC